MNQSSPGGSSARSKHRLAEFLAIVALAAISIVDGTRIRWYVREPGLFDALGPDNYLLGLAALFIVLALYRAVAGEPSSVAPASNIALTQSWRQVGLLTVLMCVYALLIPTIGYFLSTVALMTAGFWVMGVRGLLVAFGGGAAAAIGLHLTFAKLADVAFPSPWLWEWLRLPSSL